MDGSGDHLWDGQTLSDQTEELMLDDDELRDLEKLVYDLSDSSKADDTEGFVGEMVEDLRTIGWPQKGDIEEAARKFTVGRVVGRITRNGKDIKKFIVRERAFSSVTETPGALPYTPSHSPTVQNVDSIVELFKTRIGP